MEDLYNSEIYQKALLLVGKRVYKKSKKPFKSKLKINTVKDLTINPYKSDELAFSFIEDDSVVSISQCLLYGGENNGSDK